MRLAVVGAPALVALLALALAAVPPALATRNRQHHHGVNKQPTTEFVKGKICIGTNGKMSVPSGKKYHVRNLRERFTNCTYVDGNLELTWLQQDSDLSFVQHIREVTGYVLISHVDVRRIILPSLQIIRGRTLFRLHVRDEEFALMVTLSNSNTLELPALRDVLNGNVGIFNNYNLCHVKTINWEEIITGQKSKYVYVYNFTSAERGCPPCDKSCEAGCWGEGPENCQKFSKTKCSPQCWKGRCFGTNPRECCHLFCAGGCTGPKQSDCLACQNFYDDGLCTQECPPMQRYNPTSYSWESNPDGKYAYGATCVKNCPQHLLKDNGACVRSCPPKKTEMKGECVPCDGPCPKICKGVNAVHSGNIENFKDCTIIDGSLEILEQSFKGFQQVNSDYKFGPRFPEMHPDKLQVFSTLKEVTGYINIQGFHVDFTNLSCFRNLEIIGGRQMMENFFASLYIVKTSLKSLELNSLKRINSGAVIILENKNLCYAEEVAWNKIQQSTTHGTILQNNKSPAVCKTEGSVCDAQCSADGCWGSGSTQCLSCKNYQFEGTCLENCSSFSGVYKDGPKVCKPCHEECESACTGPKADHCIKCKNAQVGPFCVPKCPTIKYKAENGSCFDCHKNCVDGCLGPLNTIGPNGCNSCEKAIINGDVTIEKCLQSNETCPDGYYYEWVGPQEQGPLKPLAGKAICRKCHPRCKKCTGYGFHEQMCQECSKFKSGEQCEDECPNDHYVDEKTKICEACHVECRGCVGPDSSGCIKCRNFKIFIGEDASMDNSSSFKCTASCPPDLPNKVFSNEESVEPYCSATSVRSSEYNETAEIPLILLGVLVCLVILLFIIWFTCRQKMKARKETVKMTKVLTGCEDNEPLHPSMMKPNLAKLRIIKEDDLRKGGTLGSGAFGKVYKGVWVPGSAEGVKIPVAIKVLKEETGANTSKEFLDEAYIMASVEHPNLLQLLAVCLTQEMMLITQLMPLGCLLDYVRIHKEKIGSKALLNWCTQIARGMSYLEEKRLVHRDLAARNVLVQTPKCVKITDFGLAKLLDYNVDEYKADGGKMPIKWLALECIQHRIFTHKSDVWAFGVTIWELLTYGGKPYENISAREVPELIENGLKLPQPTICTLDIYCIMVSCWMLDADSRPCFKNLANTFAEMAEDPARYLVIQRDKFMRLPPYSVQDEKELIRSISSSIKTAESLMEGDEYLQPSFSENSGVPNGGSIDQNTLNKPCSSNSWQQGTSSIPLDFLKKRKNWEQDLVSYTQVKCFDQNSRQYCNSGHVNSDGSVSRYCSDQMKSISGDEVSGDTIFENSARIKEQNGNIKIDLPVDEDDYLMPFPQQHQMATSYMDLIGEASISEEKSPEFQKYPDFLPVTKKGLDNPEYLLTSTENINAIEEEEPAPTTPEESCAPVSIESTTQGSETVTPVAFVAQKSIEEESISDHEYYNDLQRELQPLRRNETAV